MTGRKDRFGTNRKFHGLKPFPFPTESEYDTFCCGHASNSISAALGMAVAARQQGIDRKVIAVIGDGSLSGGEAFEGLDNAGEYATNFIVVVNDNEMSIAENHGGLYKSLADRSWDFGDFVLEFLHVQGDPYDPERQTEEGADTFQ